MHKIVCFSTQIKFSSRVGLKMSNFYVPHWLVENHSGYLLISNDQGKALRLTIMCLQLHMYLHINYQRFFLHQH